MTPAELITQLYVGYYNRAPDPEGLNYWIGRLNDGVSLADIAESFAASPEALSTYPFLALPNFASPESFIEQLYLNLFNRAVDADGLAYYTAEIESGRKTPGEVIAQIQANANTSASAQGLIDAQVLANKVAVGLDFAATAANTPGFEYNESASAFANSILDGVTVDEATVAAASDQIDDFLVSPDAPLVLTSAIDALVGGNNNDVINGVIAVDADAGATFSTGDSINGGGGDDVLNLIVVDGVTVVPANLTNVETIRVQDLDGAVIDLTNAVGVETVESNNSTDDTDFTNVGNIVDVALSNSSGVDVEVEYVPSVVAGTADAQSVAFTNVTNGSVTTDGVETITVTATGENSATVFSGDLTTLNVAGAGTLATTVATSVTTLNASANTGGLTAAFAGASDVAVTGGSGDDVINFADTGFTTADTVDGGEGIDTVRVNLGVADLTAAPAAAPYVALTSVERVAFDGIGGVTLNGATFTNAGITNIEFNTGSFAGIPAVPPFPGVPAISGDDVINNAGSARTYEFGTANDGNASFAMNGTSTVLNIDLLGTTTGVTANVDDVVITLAGTQPAGTLTTLNLTSAGDLADGAFNTVGEIDAVAGSTVTVDGSGNLNIAGFAANAVVNASALTGSLVIEGSEAAGAILVAGDVTGADVFTLGSAPSVVEFDSGLDSGVTNAAGGLSIDVINGFTAGADGDVLAFGLGGSDYTAISADDQTEISLLSGAGITLQDAADIAANVGTADTWTAFTFQGQTYALYSANADADYTAGTDLVVQITGVAVADLTVDNFA